VGVGVTQTQPRGEGDTRQQPGAVEGALALVLGGVDIVAAALRQRAEILRAGVGAVAVGCEEAGIAGTSNPKQAGWDTAIGRNGKQWVTAVAPPTGPEGGAAPHHPRHIA